MISLYIDTSTKYLCIGLAKDYSVFYNVMMEANKTQSELAIPTLKKALDENNLTINDIDEVVVTIGPGSFTGLRIGMCIAKVVASIKKIPLKAISSLNAFSPLGKNIVIFDARASRVYLGIYDNNKPLIEEKVVTIDELKEIIKEYEGFDVVCDAQLIGLTSKPYNVIENMNRMASNITPVSNVDALVPIYLKDR